MNNTMTDLAFGAKCGFLGASGSGERGASAPRVSEASSAASAAAPNPLAERSNISRRESGRNITCLSLQRVNFVFPRRLFRLWSDTSWPFQFKPFATGASDGRFEHLRVHSAKFDPVHGTIAHCH